MTTPSTDEFEAMQEFYDRLSEPVMDEEDAVDAAYRRGIREGFFTAIGIFVRMLHLLFSYKGDMRMACACLFLAIGKGDEIGMESAVDAAVWFYKDAGRKATVTKCIKNFQDRLNLPPQGFQRDNKGRASMSVARSKQVQFKDDGK